MTRVLGRFQGRRTVVFTAVALLILALLAHRDGPFGPLPVHAATFTVNTTADPGIPADGLCSLREAITNANSNALPPNGDCPQGEADGDVIQFDLPDNSEIFLSTVLPAITDDLEIDGSGVPGLTISGDAGDDDNTANNVKIMFVNSTDVVISDLTLAEANSGVSGGAIEVLAGAELTLDTVTVSDNEAVAFGGGVFNSGSLTLIDSTLSGNAAGFDGGAIFNFGTLVLLSSTVGPDNSARSGGGIFNQNGTARLTNSTVSGNTAEVAGVGGGGIYNLDGTSTLVNSTVARNVADSGGGIVDASSQTVNLSNTIVAENEGGDCESVFGIFVSQGFNLDSDDTCELDTLLNDVPAGNADLTDLADNGGPTQTHALGAASDAIDAGNDDVCDDTDPADPPVDSIDQRGVERPQDGDGDGTAVCDIGAFELEALPEPPDDGVPPPDDGDGDGDGGPGQGPIDVTNNNLNLNGNDNLNNLLNNNLNENANDNANEQEQDSGQDQDNANDQVVNVSSSPDVNIGSD